MHEYPHLIQQYTYDELKQEIQEHQLKSLRKPFQDIQTQIFLHNLIQFD